MIDGTLHMIEAVALTQAGYLTNKPETMRKELGQYFTGSVVADYMASLLTPVKASSIRILDAGAGAGILTISAAMRCLALGSNQVHAVLYEIDEDILSDLEMNMYKVAKAFKEQGGKFTFNIHHEDFVLARPDRTEEPFHISSINPPYFKYNSKTSPYSGATADLFAGNPNIYASFMAIVAACMADNGQMIVIAPRSFTNGLYFKGFRQYLNRTMSLEKLHIFRSRNQVFKELNVLQENIICSYRKNQQGKLIDICTSNGYADFNQTEINTYPTKQIIDSSNTHEIIRIPESLEDAQILRNVELWASSFQDNGYFISTGPVVEHRTREYIVNPDNKTGSIPLLKMHNIKAFKTEWTGTNKKDVRFLLLDGHEKHTSKNLPYVILKRFSSKDEKRRLVAGVHNPDTIKSNLIALENHLNYIGHNEGPLSQAEAYGLALLFNSTLLDKYFRCISGSTQVNATEIRLLKLPTRDIIQQIGLAYQTNKTITQAQTDALIEHFLRTIGTQSKHEQKRRKTATSPNITQNTWIAKTAI
ncbi:Eco57I restriction-modification methylase domain-containing protein [Photorhabdus temperata]|uniref:Eco57I restriction-modification methylase domain-containing protein n=1 Tax=Photorhabdus temperata TaxID=574560 RepID=UPI0021D4D9D2|nr:Eco57I restriction-modification methylase domain-containing protein [Photorhabdus temperata]MCT8348957.1 Eco57I restriction-modification methylase domain-containing protein [Photorhabdus temperata]